MFVLGLEPAPPRGSVAVVGPPGLLTESTALVPMRHLEWLVPTVERVLADAGITRGQIEGLAVSPGPGGGAGAGLFFGGEEDPPPPRVREDGVLPREMLGELVPGGEPILLLGDGLARWPEVILRAVPGGRPAPPALWTPRAALVAP